MREIENMPYGTSAKIILDKDNDTLLHISAHNKYKCHFNVSWLKDEEKIDWLARVIGEDLYNAYMEGYIGKQNEVNEALKGLKNLFNDID